MENLSDIFVVFDLDVYLSKANKVLLMFEGLYPAICKNTTILIVKEIQEFFD
jgi:hypothetical protein